MGLTVSLEQCFHTCNASAAQAPVRVRRGHPVMHVMPRLSPHLVDWSLKHASMLHVILASAQGSEMRTRGGRISEENEHGVSIFSGRFPSTRDDRVY